MNVKPILFSGPMIRALLDGRKTMTRRVIDPQPHWVTTQPHGTVMMMGGKCGLVQALSKYGTVGDRLWVRETWGVHRCINEAYQRDKCEIGKGLIHYRADGDSVPVDKWRPSIFMPRWASRITLEITSVKVERVQDISEEDALSEGVTPPKTPITEPDGSQHMAWGYEYRYGFEKLWDSINAKRGYGWDVNPWVWVVEFKRVKL